MCKIIYLELLQLFPSICLWPNTLILFTQNLVYLHGLYGYSSSSLALERGKKNMN